MVHNVNSMETKLTQTIFHLWSFWSITWTLGFSIQLKPQTQDSRTSSRNEVPLIVKATKENKLSGSGLKNMTHGSRSILLISRRRTCPLNSRICNNFNENSKYLSLSHWNYSKPDENGNTIWSGVEMHTNVSLRFITWKQTHNGCLAAEILDLK